MDFMSTKSQGVFRWGSNIFYFIFLFFYLFSFFIYFTLTLHGNIDSKDNSDLSNFANIASA